MVSLFTGERPTLSRQPTQAVRAHAPNCSKPRAIIREKGYENGALDAIAERAGMTIGDIYGNFKNRDELLLTPGQTYWPPIKPNVKPGATFAEIMTALAVEPDG